ncbi:MAG: lipocalin family protein [Bacteroidales bacterium]|nr:lipocalin family protein [Bacteroidales bacterium]
MSSHNTYLSVRRIIESGGAKFFFVTMLLAVLTSCTRNNGDIGPWFGTWHLESIMVDGNPEVEYENNIFWAFQSEVIFLTRVPVDSPGMHTVEKRFGTWREADGTLYLKFAYSDNSDTEGYQYHAFEELHFPYGSETPLSIIKAPGREAVLQYTDADGHVYTYTIKKQS